MRLTRLARLSVSFAASPGRRGCRRERADGRPRRRYAGYWLDFRLLMGGMLRGAGDFKMMILFGHEPLVAIYIFSACQLRRYIRHETVPPALAMAIIDGIARVGEDAEGPAAEAGALPAIIITTRDIRACWIRCWLAGSLARHSCRFSCRRATARHAANATFSCARISG